MHKSNWIETKKEYEINEAGESILKKTTKELNTLRQKDVIDFLIRIIALSVIFIPIFIYFLQETKERKKQKELLQFETYTNASSNIQLLVNKNSNSIFFEKTWNDFYFKDYPRIKFLNDKTIIGKVDTIKSYLSTFLIISNNIVAFDTLRITIKNLFKKMESDVSYAPDSTESYDIMMSKASSVKNYELLFDTTYLNPSIVRRHEQVYKTFGDKSKINFVKDYKSYLAIKFKTALDSLYEIKTELKQEILKNSRSLDSILSTRLSL